MYFLVFVDLSQNAIGVISSIGGIYLTDLQQLIKTMQVLMRKWFQFCNSYNFLLCSAAG